MQADPTNQLFVMIADLQALTNNARNRKVSANVLEVALDYLAVGLDPTKTTIFIQSQIPQLAELTMYYLNLVTTSRVRRNQRSKQKLSKNLGKVFRQDSLYIPFHKQLILLPFKRI